MNKKKKAVNSFYISSIRQLPEMPFPLEYQSPRKKKTHFSTYFNIITLPFTPLNIFPALFPPNSLYFLPSSFLFEFYSKLFITTNVFQDIRIEYFIIIKYLDIFHKMRNFFSIGKNLKQKQFFFY